MITALDVAVAWILVAVLAWVVYCRVTRRHVDPPRRWYDRETGIRWRARHDVERGWCYLGHYVPPGGPRP